MARSPMHQPPGGLSLISSHAERELKLAIRADFRLPRLPGTVLPRRLLISTYYDTTAYDLARAQMTLRHRIELGKKSWQLKIPLGNDRQEVEVADALSDPPVLLRDVLILHLRHRRLVPIVTLRVWRTSVLVRHGRMPVAELAIDHITAVRNGSVIERFRELKIERRQGDEAVLHSLERQMREAGAYDHDGRAKLYRALSLPAPSLSPQPAPDAPVAEHLKWSLAQHVGWLVTHDPGTRLCTETESLHQMRVATRRLRAVLRTCRPILRPAWVMSLQEELKWLSELLGPARDLDVQIAYFANETAGLTVRDRKLLALFVAHLRTQRKAFHEVLLGELTSARYFALIRGLRQAAQAPLLVESSLDMGQLAKREFKKLRKEIKRVGPSCSDAALHRIRIKTKRARYAADLARNSLGKPAVRFIKSARAVQNLLGIHQDAIQAERFVQQFFHHSTRIRAGVLAGRLRERQRHRRDQIRHGLTLAFKALLKRGKAVWW